MKASERRKFRVGRSRTGLGLFAAEVIERGELIVEYRGMRLSNAEVERLGSARYLFEVNSRVTIDGSPRWNKARYLNHSCRPNAEPIESRGRIFINARKRIAPDEEITANYGREYFAHFIAPTGCRCAVCQESGSDGEA